MKKFLTLFFVLLLSLTTIFAFTACDKEKDDDTTTYSLYAPDGAPALSVARLLHDENALPFLDVNIVEASTIQTYVTGETPKADFAIMPVNAANKLLGSGEKYQLLGTVTHGNLFLMKNTFKDGNLADVTPSTINVLIGKKVGVINLANVPGLTFKAILADNNIEYKDISESGEVDENKVNLKGLANGTEVVPASDCDYFVVPEPAATTKQNATGGKLSIAASLQDLYGQEGGYPQAVLVVKKQIASSDIENMVKVLDSFAQNESWLKAQTTKTEDIVNAVVSGFVKEDTAPTFTADNLNTTVIENCAISFERLTNQNKGKIENYINKLNAISNNAWGSVKQEFLYIPE